MEGLNSAMGPDLKASQSHLWKYINVLQNTNLAKELKFTQSRLPGYVEQPAARYLQVREAEIERLSNLCFVDNTITNIQFIIAVSPVLSSPKE
jgi:hypothetical protein